MDRTLLGTIVLLAMLLLLLGTTTVHGFRPPLQPDSFAIYNYTRIDRGINGSYSCSTYLVLWVFSSNGSKIVYGVRAAGPGSSTCCPFLGDKYALVDVDLVADKPRPINASKPVTYFIDPRASTVTVISDVEYDDAKGFGQFEYELGVLDSAEINTSINEFINRTEIIKLLYTSITPLKTYKGLNTSEIIMVLEHVLKPTKPPKGLPYRPGDYIVWRETIATEKEVCTLLVNTSITYFSGTKIITVTRTVNTSNCSDIIFPYKGVDAVDIERPASELGASFLTNPDINGNKTINYVHETNTSYIRITGWKYYMKGILYSARLHMVTELKKPISVRNTLNESIKLIDTSIKLASNKHSPQASYRAVAMTATLVAVLAASAALLRRMLTRTP